MQFKYKPPVFHFCGGSFADLSALTKELTAPGAADALTGDTNVRSEVLKNKTTTRLNRIQITKCSKTANCLRRFSV